MTEHQRKLMERIQQGESLTRTDLNGERGKYRIGATRVREDTAQVLPEHLHCTTEYPVKGAVRRVWTWKGNEE